MSVSSNLKLPYLQAAQAQKHVTINEALEIIDVALQLSVEDKDLSAPPADPAEGVRYIVAAGASGTFAGHEDDVAVWRAGAWIFLSPQVGWRAFVRDENRLYVFTPAGWSATASEGGGAGSVAASLTGTTLAIDVDAAHGEVDLSPLVTTDAGALVTGTLDEARLPASLSGLTLTGTLSQDYANLAYGGTGLSVSVADNGNAYLAGSTGPGAIDGQSRLYWSRAAGCWRTEGAFEADGLGVGGASPDGVNRLAMAGEAALFTNANGDVRVKVNKASAAATASHLFQSDWSGRAEFGLVGGDTFVVKVSPDGSTWHTGLSVDPADGGVSVPTGLTVAGSPVVTAGDVFAGAASGLVPGSGGGTSAFLRADGTWAVPPMEGGLADGDYGDVTVSSGGAVWTIADGAVTDGNLAPVAGATLKGRDGPDSGPPRDLTAAEVRALINVEDGASADQTAAEIVAAIDADGVATDSLRTALGLGSAAYAATTAFATAAQGTKADTAVQPGDLAAVATSGAYGDLTGLPVLGTAAGEDATAFATAAQGTKADSAVQPADLAAVATSGAYGDLTGLPALGTAAGEDATAFATAAQGTKADSAVQPADLAAVATSGAYGDLSGTPGRFTALADGLAPASGGGSAAFLRADGTWAVPTGSGGVTDGDKGDVTVSASGTVWQVNAGAIADAHLSAIESGCLKGRVSAGLGAVESLTAEEVRTLLNVEDGATADQTAAEIVAAIDADPAARGALEAALALGSAAHASTDAFATAAQGARADSALQPGDLAPATAVADGLMAAADKSKLDGLSTGGGSAFLENGAGNPEGVRSAAVGTLFIRTDAAGPLESLWQKTAGSGSTGWSRVDVGRALTVRPEDFGAVGDGTTDDAAAIQAAEDHLASLGGGCLLFDGTKTYAIGTSLTKKSAITWEGVGGSATIKLLSSFPQIGGGIRTVPTSGVDVRDHKNIVLRHLTFDGNRAERGSTDHNYVLVQMNKVSHLTVEHCRFQNYAGRVFAERGGLHTKFNFNIVDNCGSSANTVGNEGVQQAACAWVSNPEGNDEYTPSRHAEISGNTFINLPFSAISVHSIVAFVTKNYCKDVHETWINATDDPDGTFQADYHFIIGNFVQNVDLDWSQSAGIECARLPHVVIADNTIVDTEYGAISINDCEIVRISGNTIIDAATVVDETADNFFTKSAIVIGQGANAMDPMQTCIVNNTIRRTVSGAQHFCVTSRSNQDTDAIGRVLIENNDFADGFSTTVGSPVHFFGTALPVAGSTYTNNSDGLLAEPTRGFWPLDAEIKLDPSVDGYRHLICTNDGYGHGGAWASGTTYALQDHVLSSNGAVYRCDEAGSGASTNEPTFSGRFDTLADGYRWEKVGPPATFRQGSPVGNDQVQRTKRAVSGEAASHTYTAIDSAGAEFDAVQTVVEAVVTGSPQGYWRVKTMKAGTLATKLDVRHNNVRIANSVAFRPEDDDGTLNGTATARWSQGHFVQPYFYPAASVTPTVNGQVTVEATDNTTLTLKYRGSDGVVRNFTLTADA